MRLHSFERLHQRHASPFMTEPSAFVACAAADAMTVRFQALLATRGLFGVEMNSEVGNSRNRVKAGVRQFALASSGISKSLCYMRGL